MKRPEGRGAGERCEPGCGGGLPGGRLAAIAIALAMLLLGGCGQSPQGVATSYVADLHEFNYPACYAMLTARDRSSRTLRQFLGEIPMAPQVDPIWFRAILFSMHYKVGKPRVDGERAVVPVKVTMPDLPLWERTIDARGGSAEAINIAADKSLRTGEYPKVTFDDAIVLVKEQHRWRVLADFTRRDMIEDRHRKALSVYHDDDYPKAVAAYQALLAELKTEQFTGSRGLEFVFGRELEMLEKDQAQVSASRAYIPMLVLSDVAVKMSEDHMPAIFGRIVNAGTRAVDDVRMTVTYYASGRRGGDKVLYREGHTVVVTPIAFTSFRRPVRPLVPGETRHFGFDLGAPADIQQKSEPNLTVTSIIFTQSKAPQPAPPVPSPTASVTSTPTPTPRSTSHPWPRPSPTPTSH